MRRLFASLVAAALAVAGPARADTTIGPVTFGNVFDCTTTPGTCTITPAGITNNMLASGISASKITGPFTSLQTIDLNAAALPTPYAGSVLHLGNADGTDTAMTFDAFAASPFVVFRRAAGTAASPSAVQQFESLGAVYFQGYGATGYTATARAGIQSLAPENWTDSAQGANVNILTTENGTTDMYRRVRFANDGGVEIFAASGVAPTGASKGVGTLNLAGDLYNNGTAPTGTGGYVREDGATLSGPILDTTLMVGSATPLTLATGEVGLAKITASGSAPGAAGLKLAVVCGTNAGTAKIIAYAGTSTTAATVLDNIGSGVTGC